jgi:hexulose-6-phosphate isomerase
MALHTTRRGLLLGAAAALTAGGAEKRFIKSVASVVFPPGLPLAECFRQARNAGFEAVEIRLPREEMNMATGAEPVRRISDAARRAGMAITAVWPSGMLNPNPLNHPEAAVRERGRAAIRKSIEFARLLNSGALLIVPGRLNWKPPHRMGYEDTWNRSAAELREVIPEAESARVMLCLENVWGGFLLSPLEMRSYIDQFRSPWVQAYFDIGNVMRFGYPEDWIRTLGARIRRVHLKDYKLPGGGREGRFVMLTEGDVPWREVMAALVRTGYRGFLSPEIGHDPKDPQQLQTISRKVDEILAMV